MIDEKELEYKTIPLGSFLSHPVLLFGVGVPLLIVAIMVLNHVPDATLPLSLLFFIGLVILAAYYNRIQSINTMKSKAIRAAYGNISESERKSAFLQKYYSEYWGMLTNVIGGHQLGPGHRHSISRNQQWPSEYQAHQLVTQYRIFLLNEKRIKISEATTNNGKVVEKEIPLSSVKGIAVWDNRLNFNLIGGKEIVFTYKTKDKEDEKIFTHSYDFLDYAQFEKICRSLYGDVVEERK